MIYGLRRMIYLLRKHDIISVLQYAEGIYHRTIVRYHTEGISLVPSGTDIIEKKHPLSDRQKVFLFCERLPKRSRIEVKKTKSMMHYLFDKLEFG